MPTKEEQKEMLNQINKVVASDFLESTLTFKCRFLGQDRSASFRNGKNIH
jgi:hypothetical protein